MNNTTPKVNKQDPSENDPSVFLAKQMLEMKKDIPDPNTLLFFGKRLLDLKTEFDSKIDELKTQIQQLSDTHQKTTDEHKGHMDDLKKMVKDALND